MKITLVLKLSALALAIALPAQLFFYTTAQASKQTRAIDFTREIRPILSDKCFACHGPDATAKKIKLRLDSEGAALADLGRGRHAIVPGQPEKSELIKRITHSDDALRMPPTDSGRSLTRQEIELLSEWIRQGAKWQSHWAFVAPIRPALPKVKNTAWPKNAIDYFVLERLEREGLQPAPEADRTTLLRRVSFDLTGLPPTPKEVDDFLNDQSPNAYEKVVDRLLASPRYGERMAFKWLDAARYADTNGYQIDGNRSAWRWRDWVIEAFNANKPFDEFTIEQLAGDLLPKATFDQRVATAFNRNHRINAEGGIVPEEYRHEYVMDRVDTTSTVFMGLTLGCSRCHNHKYDPFTQKEYYQLSAYFNSIDEDGHSFDQGNSPPVMLAPTREQQTQLARFDEDIAQAQSQLKTELEKAAEAKARWEKKVQSKPNLQWFPEDKLIVHLSLDENSKPVFNKSDRAYHDQYNRGKDEKPIKFETGFRDGSPRYVSAPTGQGVAFDGKLYFDAGIHADFRYKSTSNDYKERFTISTWIYPEAENSGSVITKVSDNPAEKENGVPRADGYGMYVINGKLHFNLVFRWGEDALRVETETPLALKQWQHVAAVFDGTKEWEDRLHIYVNGQEQKLKMNQRSFFLLFGGSKNTLKIGGGGGPEFRFKGALDDVRMYSRALPHEEVRLLANADSLGTITAVSSTQRTRTQTDKLTLAFIHQDASDAVQRAYKKILLLQEQKQVFTDSLPTLMVMEELPQPRPTFVLRRGAYDAPGESVERHAPAALPPMPAAYPANRLGLAKWLVSAEHPLTARVTVNRFWQMFFGTGLVKTTEDFGSQGELPSHPELLDWLAVELRNGTGSGSDLASGANPLATARGTIPTVWDIKSLLKTIVMSATYRQSSKLNPALQQRDPDNRLLARGPRFRLSADMIRDQALLAAGLLVEKIGGPSVKPYQPDGLYKDMAFGGLTGYDQSKGEGLWRRSLYTFWKRTILSPNMQVFDASAREFCSVRDMRTNTPLQSLNLMNDITYIEAARLLAERMLTEGGMTPQARIAWAFRILTSRLPNEKETQVLLQSLIQQKEYFSRNPEETKKLLSQGEKRNNEKLDKAELAAYATTASLMLNMDEVITKQ
ncbi:MAG: DUF1549 domain-containing protein [Acidobacteria bacterium]|nr:DUF1549 domain-containing protein [Acidobacteriota bacterium]